jgi:hypothetical protein
VSTTIPAVAVTEPSDDFTDTANTDAAETTTSSDAAVTTDAVPETVAEVLGTEPVDSTVAAPPAGGPAAATLSEWAIEAPIEYAAGDITFTAANTGSFPHELAVIEGESYEALPLEEGGAVIEAELPTGALIGRTAKIAGGASEDLTVTLVAGNYVLLCNLGGGANSHAGQGQVLGITVS